MQMWIRCSLLLIVLCVGVTDAQVRTIAADTLYNFALVKLTKDDQYNNIIAELFYRAGFKDQERDDELDILQKLDSSRAAAIKNRIEEFELGGSNFIENVGLLLKKLRQELVQCQKTVNAFTTLRTDIAKGNLQQIITKWPEYAVDIKREDSVFADAVKTKILYLIEKALSGQLNKVDSAQQLSKELDSYQEALRVFGVQEDPKNVIIVKTRDLVRLMSNIEDRLTTSPRTAEDAESAIATLDTLQKEYNAAADGNMSAALITRVKEFIKGLNTQFQLTEAKSRREELEKSLLTFMKNLQAFVDKKVWTSSDELSTALTDYQSINTNLSEYAKIRGASGSLMNNAHAVQNEFKGYVQRYFENVQPDAKSLAIVLYDFEIIKDIFDNVEQSTLRQRIKSFSKKILLDAVYALNNLTIENRIPLGDALLNAVEIYRTSGEMDTALNDELGEIFEATRQAMGTEKKYKPNKVSLQSNSIYLLMTLDKLGIALRDNAQGVVVCGVWNKTKDKFYKDEYDRICPTYLNT